MKKTMGDITGRETHVGSPGKGSDKIADVMLAKPGTWSEEQAKAIAAWLRKCAAQLEKEWLQYNDTGPCHFRYFGDREDRG